MYLMPEDYRFHGCFHTLRPGFILSVINKNYASYIIKFILYMQCKDQRHGNMHNLHAIDDLWLSCDALGDFWRRQRRVYLLIYVTWFVYRP